MSACKQEVKGTLKVYLKSNYLLYHASRYIGIQDLSETLKKAHDFELLHLISNWIHRDESVILITDTLNAELIKMGILYPSVVPKYGLASVDVDNRYLIVDYEIVQ